MSNEIELKTETKTIQPSVEELETAFAQTGILVDDIVLKKYLYKLSDCDIIPLDDEFKNIGKIRMFKITEMVYRNNEYSTYKFASVFSALQNLDSGVFVIADSDGNKTEFYMGVRAMDEKRSPATCLTTLENTLRGQFPGVKTDNRFDVEQVISGFADRNIASVTCVAKNKNEQFVENEKFLQGLDKFALSMQGRKYTAVILAKGTSPERIDELAESYEAIYKNLSPFANMQLSYGYNEAISISDSLSTSESYNKSVNRSVSEPDKESAKTNAMKKFAIGIGAGLLGLAAAPLTGGASLAVGLAIGAGTSIASTAVDLNNPVKQISTGDSEGINKGSGKSHQEGQTTGSTQNMQLNMQNKKLIDTLETIDTQLKRLKECRDLGMWECAAYFLADNQQDVEIAAGAYKALMSGENSGVESSAINVWNRKKAKELPLLRDYITNFIHPLFVFNSGGVGVPVSAAAYVSSNELAIHMGLPRRSVSGLPVIEHAQFAKEVVKYSDDTDESINLGKVFDMGKALENNVDLDINSLTMHTFVTGSTGAGKSNTIYHILDTLKTKHKIPFMVVEPAKGEYKNIFCQFKDVTVYGTNPKLTRLLRINPFSFPDGVHVLEHIDRIVELFNVCWPMYAAMPAIMKEAIEKAYVATGWDIDVSENPNGRLFPNFADLLEQIKDVLNSSEYSADTKGDYSGALLTRVRSLTTGLNRQLFCADEIEDAELFDKSVVVDLSRVGSTETKSLIMGLLIIKLNEYRMDSGAMNSPLRHICVLEEAHNLLKKTSTEQSSESANLTGKSVELLASSIAEMRTYGEGFIIADQSPGLLDMSVIRNTNTKIILRLPEKSDRELVGYAAGLNKDQIPELAKLKKGVAALYQNDWVEPVLVQINKCKLPEKPYQYIDTEKTVGKKQCVTELVNFLVQGRVDEPLPFDVEKIGLYSEKLGLPRSQANYLNRLGEEYKNSGKLNCWDDENFYSLARTVTDLLQARGRVEKSVTTAADNNALTDDLRRLVEQSISEASEAVVLTLSQCFMKDFEGQSDEPEFRKNIYACWVESLR